MKLQEFYSSVYRPRIQDLRECTRVGYESAWTIHIEQQLGEVDMHLLSSEIVSAWLKGFEKPGAAKKSWAVLRAMLKLARKKGIEAPDPATLDITVPKPAHYIPKLLEIGEIRTLLKGFFGHRLEAWLLVSATLGLRREEGLALEWSDIDLKRGIVHITKGLQWINGHELLVEPKTALSRRDLVLGPLVKRRLKEIKKATNARGRLIGDLNPLQVARQYKAFCQKNGLPYVPAMNLRTTWATNALKAGIDISIVAKCLGHSNIQTTARYYLMQDIEVLRDTAVIWETKILKENGVWSFGRAA